MLKAKILIKDFECKTYIDNFRLEIGERRLEGLHARRVCDVCVDEEGVGVDVEDIAELVQDLTHDRIRVGRSELADDVLPAVCRVRMGPDEQDSGRLLRSTARS